MRLVKPSHKILFISPKPLEIIEAAGRTCYKSEDKISEGSAEKFVRMIIKRGHLSVIEHAYMSV
ncbi:FAD-dependent thymidylate synthase, partial [candidate division WOR-3 bacterium]|nr:FAD-dependent thymidylate synthase [candidate division WOR-3 bacterium]